MSARIYEAVTSTILASLRRGVVPWKKPWHTAASLPMNIATRKPYRGVNVFLLALAPYTDHRWLSFKQAEELGGRVRRGERATMVIFWKQWEKPEDEDDKEGKRTVIPVLRYYCVWNVEQCEGLPVSKVEPLPPRPEHERSRQAEALIQSMIDPPRIEEKGDSAWYHPGRDLVRVPPLSSFHSADQYYGTLFHELAHAVGHPKRLNRPGVADRQQFDAGEYSREELVAELTSAFCCATVGLDNSLTEDAASYIGGWLQVLGNDPKAVVVAAAQAQRSADWIKGIRYAE